MRPFQARFFAFLRPMRDLRDELEASIQNLEGKIQSNQKVLIFIGFLNVFEGLPKQDKNRPQNSDNLKTPENIVKRDETKNTDFYNVFKARHR